MFYFLLLIMKLNKNKSVCLGELYFDCKINQFFCVFKFFLVIIILIINNNFIIFPMILLRNGTIQKIFKRSILF